MAEMKRFFEEGERPLPVTPEPTGFFARWKHNRAARERREMFIRGRAYSEGRDDGFTDGFNVGRPAGYASGWDEGYEAGVRDTKEAQSEAKPEFDPETLTIALDFDTGPAVAAIKEFTEALPFDGGEITPIERVADALEDIAEALAPQNVTGCGVGDFAPEEIAEVFKAADEIPRAEVEFSSIRGKSDSAAREVAGLSEDRDAQNKRIAFVSDRALDLSNLLEHVKIYGFSHFASSEELNREFDRLVGAVNVLRRANDIGAPDMGVRVAVTDEFVAKARAEAEGSK